jgi:hypothetical protein
MIKMKEYGVEAVPTTIIDGKIKEPDWKGGPHVSFRTSFPKPGLYKTWGQFQHKGKIIIADFILEVV